MIAALLRPLPLLLCLFLWGGAATVSAPAAGLTPGWQARLSALLPVAGQVATVLEKRPSLSTVDLQLQVARVGGSVAALQAVLISAAKGVLAPYDARLGISEKDYRQYLVFQEVLASTGRTVRLPVSRSGDRVYFGDAPGLNGILNGVSISLKTGELRGPEGYGAMPTSVVPSSAEDRVLDVRSGFQWKVIGSDATSGNGVRGTLNLLQLSSGQIVLNYTRTSMIHRKMNTGEIIVGYTR